MSLLSSSACMTREVCLCFVQHPDEYGVFITASKNCSPVKRVSLSAGCKWLWAQSCKKSAGSGEKFWVSRGNYGAGAASKPSRREPDTSHPMCFHLPLSRLEVQLLVVLQSPRASQLCIAKMFFQAQ